MISRIDYLGHQADASDWKETYKGFYRNLRLTVKSLTVKSLTVIRYDYIYFTISKESKTFKVKFDPVPPPAPVHNELVSIW